MDGSSIQQVAEMREQGKNTAYRLYVRLTNQRVTLSEDSVARLFAFVKRGLEKLPH